MAALQSLECVSRYRLVSRKLYPSSLLDPCAELLRDRQLTRQPRVVGRADRKLELLVFFVRHLGQRGIACFSVAVGGGGDQDVARRALAVAAAGREDRREVVSPGGLLCVESRSVSESRHARKVRPTRRTIKLSPS